MEQQQQEKGEGTIMRNNIAITLAITRATSITLQGGFVSFVCVKFCHHHISCNNNNVIKGRGGCAGVATIGGRKGEGHYYAQQHYHYICNKKYASITWGGDFFFLHDFITMLVIMFFVIHTTSITMHIMGMIGFLSFAS